MERWIQTYNLFKLWNENCILVLEWELYVIFVGLSFKISKSTTTLGIGCLFSINEEAKVTVSQSNHVIPCEKLKHVVMQNKFKPPPPCIPISYKSLLFFADRATSVKQNKIFTPEQGKGIRLTDL